MDEDKENNANFDLSVNLPKSRFGNSTNDDILGLVENRHSKNTKKSIKSAVTVFR